MIFLTSDTHFAHNKSFLYANRGYECIEDMNKDLIDKWNSIISPEDTVYHLGDVMLGNNEEGLACIKLLKGHIHIILGNHDTDARKILFQSVENIEDITYADIIKDGKWKFFLSHYPCMVGDINNPKRRWNISGHTHSTDKFQFKDHLIYNAAVDAHNGFPISIEDIKKDIKELINGRN